MSIKNKSNILVLIFSILLIVNGIGMYLSMSKIKNANEHLIDETHLSLKLEKMKFIVKDLQELSTDITLMGDKEALKNLSSLIEEYKTINKEIKSKNTHKDNKEILSNMETIFNSYTKSLLNMTKNGIQSVEQRNIFFQKFSTIKNNQLNDNIRYTYDKFFKAAYAVESEMEILDVASENLNKNIIQILKNQDNYLEQSIKEDLDLIDTFKTVTTLLTVVFLIAVIALFVVIKNILSNIQKLDEGVENLNKGNSSKKIEISSKDELANISNNFNKYIDKIESELSQDRKAIEDASNVIEKVITGLYNDNIKTKAASKELTILINQINNMIKTTQINLNILSDFLAELSRGNFTVPMKEVNLTGLLSSIFQGSEITQTSINEVMAIIDNSTKRLIFSADDLADASNNLSSSSNQQAAALEETAAAIEEVTSTIRSGNENTARMLTYASDVTNSSNTGITLAQQTSESMEQLSNEVNTINEAITIIDQIAFQTNILSLNAAVEAATAGEAGKGFAVVAQEVRNLASRSAEAANEIKRLVESATSKANEGKEVSTKMIDGFNELNTNIASTIEIIEEVANSTKEQEQAMNQINDTVNTLDKATQENASLASKINHMAMDTKELSQALKGAVEATTFDEKAKRRVSDPKFVFEINNRKTDHVVFKNVNMKECEIGNKFTVKSHLECKFGNWILENENTQIATTQEWEDLKIAHRKVHMMVQDSVDLYADGYSNGQIFSVTQNLEKEMKKVFNLMDRLKEIHSDILFNER